MRVALAQIAPVLLDREATLKRIVSCIDEAAKRECRLVCFGESLLPGYPVWLSRSDGARFDSKLQKEFHALYMDQAVRVERGDLESIQQAAYRGGIAVALGVVERAVDRGGHSLFCSAVSIGIGGELGPLHRKLMPTYEERLAWGMGDGAGLVPHALDDFTVGVLNCWENWMPLARAALYAQGEDLHVALWPGGEHNTRLITPFIAREGRSFAVSVSGFLRASDIPADLPGRRFVVGDEDEVLMNGGSCVAGPDGNWLVEPMVGREGVITVDLDSARVREERQNFDPAGHYSRPDVLQLVVDRRRQTALTEIGKP